MEFSDRDILTDLLLDTKMLSTGYHIAVLEAANDRVRNVLIQVNNEELNTQKQIFNLMHSRGWYQLDPVYTGAPMNVEATGVRPETTMGRVSSSPGVMGTGAERTGF